MKTGNQLGRGCLIIGIIVIVLFILLYVLIATNLITVSPY